MSSESDKDTLTTTAEELWLQERIERIRGAGLLFDLDDITRHLKEAIDFGRGLSKSAPAKRSKFEPPTVEEVAAYIRYLQSDIDPNAFIDHYTANGWRQGSPGRPIKDWRACLRTWKNNGIRRTTNGTGTHRPGRVAVNAATQADRAEKVFDVDVQD